MSTEWVIVPLHKQHNRTHFDCGEPELNTYLQKFARQNDENYLGKTFWDIIDVLKNPSLRFITKRNDELLR